MSGKKLILLLTVILSLTALLIAGCNGGSATEPTTTATALSISTGALPDASIGISYSQTLNASGGTGPYSWKIIEGSLPGGFSLSSRTGSISGMPLSPGTHNFTVEVSDSADAVVTKALSITIKAASVPLTSGTSFMATGEEGVPYSQTLKAYGGSGEYTWSISTGSLPEGLTLDEKTGIISGTVSKAGKYIFSTRVTDSLGAFSTESLTLTINKRVNIITESLRFGEDDIIYAQRVEAADGVGNYSWSVSEGELPQGLQLNKVTGEISGTPADAGMYEFTLMVTGELGGTGTRSMTLEVRPNVSITTESLPGGKVGEEYSQTIEFTGGNDEYVVALAEGELPIGLTLDGNTGKISGTPKAAGTSTFKIEVIDSWGSFDEREYTIEVK